MLGYGRQFDASATSRLLLRLHLSSLRHGISLSGTSSSAICDLRPGGASANSEDA